MSNRWHSSTLNDCQTCFDQLQICIASYFTNIVSWTTLLYINLIIIRFYLYTIYVPTADSKLCKYHGGKTSSNLARTATRCVSPSAEPMSRTKSAAKMADNCNWLRLMVSHCSSSRLTSTVDSSAGMAWLIPEIYYQQKQTSSSPLISTNQSKTFKQTCTGCSKQKYPTRQYAVSPQSVVWFLKLLKLINPDTSRSLNGIQRTNCTLIVQPVYCVKQFLWKLKFSS